MMSPKYRRDIQDAIDPNVYIVIHLEPFMKDKADRTMPWTSERADILAYQFVANVSRRVLGKTAYRKRKPHRKRLPNIVTLEHQGGFPHLNINIRRPDKCSFGEFAAICREEAAHIRWFRRTEKAVYISERTGNCTIYSMKAGATKLDRSMSFCR